MVGVADGIVMVGGKKLGETEVSQSLPRTGYQQPQDIDRSPLPTFVICLEVACLQIIYLRCFY